MSAKCVLEILEDLKVAAIMVEKNERRRGSEEDNTDIDSGTDLSWLHGRGSKIGDCQKRSDRADPR